MPVITRFAPSPTGQMHLGNARTALFNWLAARHDGGRFLLRFEDTDRARAVSGAEDAILADLAWLGLDHDCEPWRQSGRTDEYGAAITDLAAHNRIYPCFCSEAELKVQRRAQEQAGRPPRYAGTCAGLDKAEAARRVAAGEAHTLRFRVPRGATIAFTDRVHGEVAFASDDIGDFVVQRSDGSPAFFFANALDDALTGVTLVLRGEDHLSNTPRQIMVLAALGYAPPEYGHLQLILDTGGGPLSKRAGALSVASLRERGYHPLALANYLARVGGHVASDEVLTLDALARTFDPTKFARASAHYDEDQLDHWQRKVLDSLDRDALWAWMGHEVVARVAAARRDAFIDLVRPNSLFPGDALDWAFVLFDDDPAPQSAAVEILQAADPALFRTALDADTGDWNTWIGQVRAGTAAKGPALFKPLRAALTGRVDGPELAGIFGLLTPERIRTRLARALELSSA